MQISYKNISINLCELTDMDSYLDTPFIIFEKKNFLNKKAYENLIDEIHGINNFQFKFQDRGDKLRTIIGGNNVDKIENEYLKNFCKLILKKDFYDWFKKTHLPYFKNKKYKFYVQNSKSIIFKLFNKIIKILNLPINFYYTEIEYSLIQKDGYIPPHTDAPKKRLSFVYYLPSKDIALDDNQKEALGTVFWSSKNKNSDEFKLFHSKFLLGENKKSFYDHHEVAFIAKYEPNKIAGFIKSDISWHTVEKINFDYPRRAIVINIFEA